MSANSISETGRSRAETHAGRGNRGNCHRRCLQEDWRGRVRGEEARHWHRDGYGQNAERGDGRREGHGGGAENQYRAEGSGGPESEGGTARATEVGRPAKALSLALSRFATYIWDRRH